MTNYIHYQVKDFIQDFYFIDWVLNATDEHDVFWNRWLLDNPEKKFEVENARRIVSSITVKPLDISLNDTDVADILEFIKSRLSSN